MRRNQGAALGLVAVTDLVVLASRDVFNPDGEAEGVIADRLCGNREFALHCKGGAPEQARNQPVGTPQRFELLCAGKTEWNAGGAVAPMA